MLRFSGQKGPSHNLALTLKTIYRGDHRNDVLYVEHILELHGPSLHPITTSADIPGAEVELALWARVGATGTSPFPRAFANAFPGVITRIRWATCFSHVHAFLDIRLALLTCGLRAFVSRSLGFAAACSGPSDPVDPNCAFM